HTSFHACPSIWTRAKSEVLSRCCNLENSRAAGAILCSPFAPVENRPRLKSRTTSCCRRSSALNALHEPSRLLFRKLPVLLPQRVDCGIDYRIRFASDVQVTLVGQFFQSRQEAIRLPAKFLGVPLHRTARFVIMQGDAVHHVGHHLPLNSGERR